MECKTWKVYNKGKAEQILIVLGGYIFFGYLILAALGVWRRARINDSLQEILILVSVASIPILLVMLKRILKSKTPIEITLNSDSQLLVLVYSKEKRKEIDFSNLAYSIITKSRSRVLTFFSTYIGTRGQTVYQEEVEIYGIKYSSSWTIEIINEIIEKLVEVNIEHTYPRNKNLPLWERMIST